MTKRYRDIEPKNFLSFIYATQCQNDYDSCSHPGYFNLQPWPEIIQCKELDVCDEALYIHYSFLIYNRRSTIGDCNRFLPLSDGIKSNG